MDGTYNGVKGGKWFSLMDSSRKPWKQDHISIERFGYKAESYLEELIQNFKVNPEHAEGCSM